MKIESKDLIPLRVPATVLVSALVLAFVLIGYINDKRDEVEGRVQAARAAAEEAGKRYRDSDLEKAMISQYLPQYQDLQRHGFIGTENRISWIDALRIADQQTGNFGVQYQLSAQAPYKGILSTEPIAQKLRQSTMEIRFGVVHEGQFLAFLNALERQNAGMYTVRTCSLEPRHADKPQPRTQNLSAQCEIDWVTLVPQEAEQS